MCICIGKGQIREQRATVVPLMKHLLVEPKARDIPQAGRVGGTRWATPRREQGRGGSARGRSLAFDLQVLCQTPSVKKSFVRLR